MDLPFQLPMLFLSLIGVSLMLGFTITGFQSIQRTQDFVTAQNHSDAYTNRYASLSSFDADSVGKISTQEALTLVYNYSTDDTPVIVQGPDNVVHVYATGSGGWKYNSHGKPLGKKLDAKGNYYNGEFDTSIPPLDLTTEAVPEYKELYKYLATSRDGSDVYYLANIDPENKGDLKTILLKATK